MRWLSQTFSVVIAVSFALLVGAWPLRADLMDGAMVVARQVIPPNIQNGPYALSQSDAFHSAVWMSGGNALTIPGASNFFDGSRITICNSSPNDNTHHAVLQPAAPAPAFVRLYMQQCETLLAVAGSWEVNTWQGKFRPGFVPTCFVDNGGNDSNDCLVSNAAGNAVANPQTCWTIFQREMDLGTAQPACSLTGGQTFTGGVVCSAAQVATVYFLIGNGGRAIIRNTAGNVVVQENDFCGYIIYDNLNLDCTSAASHPCYGIFDHQQNGVDLSTGGFTNGVTFTGANSADIGLYCDSVCKVNSAATVTFAGTLSQGFSFNLGSMADINNGVTTAANTTISNNIFLIATGSQLVYSGALTAGATTSVGQIFSVVGNGTQVCIATLTTSGTFTGARQWAVLNQGALFNQSATAIPGSAGLNTAGSGFTAGTVTATSGAACS